MDEIGSFKQTMNHFSIFFCRFWYAIFSLMGAIQITYHFSYIQIDVRRLN